MFISFEGLDGSGKTTIISLLKDYLERKYNIDQFVFTREPGGLNSKIAEEIRGIILDNKNDIDPMSEALLYLTSRNIHVNRTIIPALKSNKIVICDRYIDSSIAYQGNGRNLGMDLIEKLNLMIVNNLIPKYTFYLKISYDVSLNRISKQRMELDRLEKENQEFFQKVLLGYELLSQRDKERYIVIDANQDLDIVLKNVIEKFEEIIQKEKIII